VLKDKRLYPDIVAIPKDKTNEIVMLEFQGYKEPMIKYIWAHFKKGGIFLALKGLHIPAQGNALGNY